MNDPKNKQTFKKFKIEAFREMDVQSTIRKLVEMYGAHLGLKKGKRAEIGYIGYSNKRWPSEGIWKWRIAQEWDSTFLYM